MRRICAWRGVLPLLGLAFIVGCDASQTAAPKNSSPGSTQTGAPNPYPGKGKRITDPAEITTKIEQQLELTDVKLTPAGEGSYSGTGKRKSGQAIEFTVRQGPVGPIVTITSNEGVITRSLF